MAYAPNSYTGNGSTVLFPFSFPYIDRAHVKVAVNGVLTTAFTFANATTIQLNSAPSVGVPILIYRDTPSDAAEATIFAGSAIRASDLNANTTQLLYVAEETEFGTETANNTANAAASAAANAVSSAAAANTTAGNALSAANGAVTTANAASSTANTALSTANAASSAASGAVSTANAANATAASALGVANQAADDADDALLAANSAVSTAGTAASNASTALSTANTALNTANTAATNASAAVGTANTANNTANTALSTAAAAVNTANSASSAASAAVSTANTASSNASTALSTANTAASNASTALSTANTAASNASAAVSTANSASSTASNALSVANAAGVTAQNAFDTADNAESAAVVALANSNAALAAVATAVANAPVADLTALGLLTPADGDFFELQNSTGAETSSLITGVTVGLVGDAGLTFRLRYDDPPGIFTFLGYFANNPEVRYAEIATEALAASAQADADQALLDAAAAQSTADSAVSAAAAAQSTADSAVSAAAAAQSTANAALPKAGGTMTGAITFAGGQSFPGVLPTSGGTMTGNITFNGSQTFPVGGIQDGTTAQKGVVQLTDSVSSTSITTAATPNSVKSANDNANTRALKSGDTFTGSVTFPDGSLSSPGVRFSGSSNTGFIRTAGGDVSVVVGGRESIKFRGLGEAVFFGRGTIAIMLSLDRTDTSGGGNSQRWEHVVGEAGGYLLRDHTGGQVAALSVFPLSSGDAGRLNTYNPRTAGTQAGYAARAMLKYNGSINSLVYSRSITGVTKNSAGSYTVTMAEARGGVNYTVLATSSVNTAAKNFIGTTINVDQTTTKFILNNSSDFGTIVDSNMVHVAVFDG